MATATAPRLPPNKLGEVARQFVHYATAEAANDALFNLMSEGTPRATAHASVEFIGRSGKPLDFAILQNAIFPVDDAAIREFEDNAIDPSGKRKGFKIRRRRDPAVEAQGAKTGDRSKGSGGGTGGKGKGSRGLTQKKPTNTMGMNGPTGMGNT
ncbi:MAG: hypothetical protein ABTQ34_06470 [Bdellovibrionales bacterium]